MRLHDRLSAQAIVWAIHRGFAIGVTEIDTGIEGIADGVAFGIIKGKKRGAVFESKTSRADFLRDKKKRHRRHEHVGQYGVGEAYYVTTPGLLKPEEIPEGWGLLESDGECLPVVKKRAKIVECEGRYWGHRFALTARIITQRYLMTCHGAKYISGGIALLPDSESYAEYLEMQRDTKGYCEIKRGYVGAEIEE